MQPKGTDASGADRANPAVDPDLLGWRRVQLLRAGFDDEQAFRVAADEAIDLHALIDLVECGCPPELALRILWPLEREDPPW